MKSLFSLSVLTTALILISLSAPADSALSAVTLEELSDSALAAATLEELSAPVNSAPANSAPANSTPAAQPKIPISAHTKKHLTIASVETIDLTNEYENIPYNLENNIFLNNTLNLNAVSLSPIGGALDQIDLIVSKVINIGQKIWNIVEKGKPVATYASSKATALPANTTRWDQLESWQAPRSKVISVVYKNVYGIEVVRFTYRILLLYGGTVNGVGKYIGYAAVEPIEMTTSYMYTFNAKANVEAVFNMGTSQNPLAGMILNINWTVETVLKKSTVTHSYTLDGLGNITVPNDKISDLSSLR